MRHPHEPHDDFVERLQWQLRTEVRRRQRLAPIDRAPSRPRWRVAVAALGLAIVSMCAGGAIVAGATQAQTNQQRDLLAARYQRRADLEKERLAITSQKVAEAERRVQLGIAGTEELFEEKKNLAELRAQIGVLDIQVQEVRISGQEPVDGVTAPLVGNRDFVTERWRLEQAAIGAALEYERMRLREATRRFEVGVAGDEAVVDAQMRVGELQAAFGGFDSRLALRQRFVNKELDATETELRALEAEARLHKMAASAKIIPARAALERMMKLFNVGLASQLQMAEAQLKVHEIEADLAKIDVDLALVQAKLAKRIK